MPARVLTMTEVSRFSVAGLLATDAYGEPLRVSGWTTAIRLSAANLLHVIQVSTSGRPTMPVSH